MPDFIHAFFRWTDGVPTVYGLLLLLVIVILYKWWQGRAILRAVAKAGGVTVEEARELIKLGQESKRKK